MSTPKRIPPWKAERVALGEHDGDARLDEEQRAELARSTQEILAALPPAQVAAEVERRLRVERARREQRRARGRRVTAVIATATVCAAAAALLLLARGGDGERVALVDPATGGGPTRIKGDAHLVVHRRSEGGSERLDSGAEARAGDQLQVAYVAAGRRHGVIVSIDGGGAVTLHFPEQPSAPTTLATAADGAVPLAHSYRLDDAPGFERFVFVTSDEPLAVDAVIAAAEALAEQPEAAQREPLAGPAHWQQSSFLLRKQESP